MSLDDEDFDAAWEDALAHLEDEDHQDNHHDPHAVEDAHVVETVAQRALRDRYCWAAGLDWLAYRRGRWTQVPEATVVEAVRLDLRAQVAQETRDGAPVDRLKRLTPLLSASRIRSITSLARGVVQVPAEDFDQHPDLLNVGNGVVELASGELLPHDPGLYLTKGTDVPYVAGATSPDWAAALEALPPEVAAWLQVRIGQAATGHPTPDDLLCVLQGGGSNGKTTITGAIHRALGDHAVVVPERLLLANPSDHPTELMTLRGARLALIEETPEARRLSVKRLKDTVGTPTMTARLVRQDNVTWTATHSLFLTTNYLPRIEESDHGTWRRLALVRFPYCFVAPGDKQPTTDARVREGSPRLRERLRDGAQGQHQAVLAWVVAGARRYLEHRVMPPLPAQVRADTSAWRAEADLVSGFVAEHLAFDNAAHVIATDLYGEFTRWAANRGHQQWSDQTFTARFAEHELVQQARVEKRQTKDRAGQSRPFPRLEMSPAPKRYMAWLGVRFRTADDPADEEEDGEGASRARGQPIPARGTALTRGSDHPLHPLHTSGQNHFDLGLDHSDDKEAP